MSNFFTDIEQDIVNWAKSFEQDISPPNSKLVNEFFEFLAGFPYTQVAAAAIAEGINIPLDATAGASILADLAKSFYSGQTVQTATASMAAKMGISPEITSQIVYDPVHPADPTQFSRGR